MEAASLLTVEAEERGVAEDDSAYAGNCCGQGQGGYSAQEAGVDFRRVFVPERV